MSGLKRGVGGRVLGFPGALLSNLSILLLVLRPKYQKEDGDPSLVMA